MDNKPLENEAEDFIKNRLSKAGIGFAKPSYDVNGSDLLLLDPVNKHFSRQVVVQSKGRSVKKNSSNIRINRSYVVSNFICFLYITSEDLADHCYIFFSDDIREWSLSGEEYILYIPKGFKESDYFSEHKFELEFHTKKIKDLLSDGPLLRESYIPFERMRLMDVLFETWKKYDSMPDFKLVRALYDESEDALNSSKDLIFLTYAIATYAEELKYRNLDDYMQYLYNIRNSDRPLLDVVEINQGEILRLNSSWSYVYPRVRFGQLEVTYDGIEYKALYCYIGDREDYVEAMVFDNGDYICHGMRQSLL